MYEDLEQIVAMVHDEPMAEFTPPPVDAMATQAATEAALHRISITLTDTIAIGRRQVTAAGSPTSELADANEARFFVFLAVRHGFRLSRQ